MSVYSYGSKTELNGTRIMVIQLSRITTLNHIVTTLYPKNKVSAERITEEAATKKRDYTAQFEAVTN